MRVEETSNKQIVEGAASNGWAHLQKSGPGHTEYRLQAKEYKKKVTCYLKQPYKQ